MTLPVKYDRMITGIISGTVLPFIVGIVIYLFSSDGIPVRAYLQRIAESDIITHSITLCVFPNIFIFLLFNRLDMLRATRGILAVTITWAIIVFGIKFLA